MSERLRPVWLHRRTGQERSELQYGGEVFERASAAVRTARRSGSARRRPAAAAVTLALSDPGGAFAVVRVVTGVPWMRVSLSDHPAGLAIRRELEGRVRGIPTKRIGRGVLSLPASQAAYLAGRRRRALKANLRHAKEMGIACLAISDVSEREAIFRAWAGHEHGPLDDVWIDGEPASGDRWVALDAQGIPLALATMSVDVEWAMIHALVSTSHLARKCLHTSMVGAAIEAGARQLIVPTRFAPDMEPNLQHFQRMLGYRVVNLSLRSPRTAQPF